MIWQSSDKSTSPGLGLKVIPVTVIRVIYPHHNASRRWRAIVSNLCWYASSCSVVSFTQCSPTCGRMSLPALSLWPGHQPCRLRLVGGRRGGGPSSMAPCSRNPPTGHRRDSPISSSLFSHGPPLCAVG